MGDTLNAIGMLCLIGMFIIAIGGFVYVALVTPQTLSSQAVSKHYIFSLSVDNPSATNVTVYVESKILFWDYEYYIGNQYLPVHNGTVSVTKLLERDYPNSNSTQSFNVRLKLYSSSDGVLKFLSQEDFADSGDVENRPVRMMMPNLELVRKRNYLMKAQVIDDLLKQGILVCPKCGGTKLVWKCCGIELADSEIINKYREEIKG